MHADVDFALKKYLKCLLEEEIIHYLGAWGAGRILNPHEDLAQPSCYEIQQVSETASKCDSISYYLETCGSAGCISPLGYFFVFIIAKMPLVTFM